MALAAGTATADVPAADTVLLSNSRVAVTRADFEVELERVPVENRFEFLARMDRIVKLLEEILMIKTLAAEARELGLDKLPQTRIKLDKAQERVLASERAAHLEVEAKLPDFELRAKETYKLNPEKYTDKPVAHAYHILIALKDRSKEEALKLAQDVQAQALKGLDFGELAVKYSDDTGSSEKKGDLGDFTPDKMVKPFSDAVFAMKKGEISAPVESKFGYHVIKLIDIKPAVLRDYATVRKQILEGLKTQYLAEYKVKHMANIRADKNMKIIEAEIEKLKTTLSSTESPK